MIAAHSFITPSNIWLVVYEGSDLLFPEPCPYSGARIPGIVRDLRWRLLKRFANRLYRHPKLNLHLD